MVRKETVSEGRRMMGNEEKGIMGKKIRDDKRMVIMIVK